jgi:type VI protein secretion system component Hcp
MRSRDEIRDSELPEALDQDRHAGRPLPVAGSGRVLALQRSVGNRSLSARLARDPDTPVPEEKATPMSAGGTGVVTLGDVGAIPVSSATLGSTQEQPAHMGGGGSAGKSNPREMSFTSSVGDHSTKLFKALTDGTVMPGDVAVAAFHLTLTDAIVSRYSTSGGEIPTESWSLGFASVAFNQP